MDAKCEQCGAAFVAQRSTARYCTATCRQRAARDRKAAATLAREEAKTGTPAEHDLVKAVRLELASFDAVMTVPGQLALQLARKLANPDESALSALSKELRTVLAEAKGAAAKPKTEGATADDDSDEAEDEVTRARRERSEARAAAGLA